ncbi:hypothetical protein BCR39DRAFT_556484 [Naematelia encephala]|uniref:Uncharacterized protein n=1 Tax=Naematelia encephala TaxID=71784 RepID=A0A1Y2BLI6_9TREE|nr:hypothetical protein BCR39DRAFT_556484 [Naematelia encephala]
MNQSLLPVWQERTLSMAHAWNEWISVKSGIGIFSLLEQAAQSEGNGIDIEIVGDRWVLGNTDRDSDLVEQAPIQLPNCFTITSNEQTWQDRPFACLTLRSYDDQSGLSSKEALAVHKSDDFDEKRKAFRTFWTGYAPSNERISFAKVAESFNISYHS